ncbi:MAG: hypothetical protein WD034_11965 [Parvibaculum sp.]|jgi:hypothetical protein|uniref:hypothetical protein n=1 Tax=Parvibaculum sp. TaxID=2024848 RepID=UPI0034A079FF
MAGPEKSTDDARQGVTGTGTRYVFAISTAAAVVALLVVTWAFFGPPILGLERAQTKISDDNPPYTAPREVPDWQEPAPVRNPENPAP